MAENSPLYNSVLMQEKQIILFPNYFLPMSIRFIRKASLKHLPTIPTTST